MLKTTGFLKYVIASFAVLVLAGICLQSCGRQKEDKPKVESVRKERRAIMFGNKLYHEGKYADAVADYEKALKANGMSSVAVFNLGLSNLQLASQKGDSTKIAQFKQKGTSYLQSLAGLAPVRPDIASMASYNLGNFSFNSDDTQGAVQLYKQALRLNPLDNNARRNLRIAQLKQQQNQQDNKDNKDNRQNQDENKDENKDNKDKNRDNQDQKQDQQNQPRQPKQNEIDQQAANQILQAVENKENQTRARLNQQGKGNKAGHASASNKNW